MSKCPRTFLIHIFLIHSNGNFFSIGHQSDLTTRMASFSSMNVSQSMSVMSLVPVHLTVRSKLSPRDECTSLESIEPPTEEDGD